MIGVIAAELAAGRLDLPLEEIYGHAIECDLSGVGGYRVEDRLKGCVQMLREFADRSGPEASPRFLVLAGAACRVPLSRQLLRAEFPDALIVPEEEVIPVSYRPKSKVADGLARFLRASRGGTADARVRGLRPAHLFTHADLLWINPIQRGFPVVWVPSCTELQKGDWHLLKLDDDSGRVVPLQFAWSRPEQMEIDVHRRASPEPELVGTARLDRPAELIEPGVTPRPARAFGRARRGRGPAPDRRRGGQPPAPDPDERGGFRRLEGPAGPGALTTSIPSRRVAAVQGAAGRRSSVLR